MQDCISISVFDDMAKAKIETLEERVNNHIRFFWVVIGFGICWLAVVSGQLYYLKGDIGKLLPASELAKAATLPNAPKNQAEVVRILGEAKKSLTPLPVDVVNESSRSFLTASQNNPDAWNTVRAFMEYRAHLNSLEFSIPNGFEPEPTQYTVKTIPGKLRPQFMVSPSGVPESVAARFQEIGKPTNPDVRVGPARLIASGGAASIDGLDMAHVVFSGVEVHYSGSTVRLEDVLFVNCTFIFDNVEKSRQLAASIISSERVSFPSS